jgi:hypothetical protein
MDRGMRRHQALRTPEGCLAKTWNTHLIALDRVGAPANRGGFRWSVQQLAELA